LLKVQANQLLPATAVTFRLNPSARVARAQFELGNAYGFVGNTLCSDWV
jgi:hypothetical protein